TEVGNRFQIIGALFLSKHAVQVTANGYVPAVACNLANMIKMINQFFQIYSFLTGIGSPPDPIVSQHPGIQSSSDYSTPVYKRGNLTVLQLALVVDQASTIVMTGPD